jgi:DNA-binding transcriptional MerR regulator
MAPTSSSAETGEGTAPEVTLTVAGVARRLGVAPATLRTWDRRYGLGPSAHTAGSHRRYRPVDVARLALMRRLTVEGMAPGDAARAAKAAGEAELAAQRESAPEPDGALRGPTPEAGDVGDPSAVLPAIPLRRAGGRQLPLPPGADEPARGLARAALALDGATCAELVSAHVQRHGVVRTWDTLVVPVLQAVGERWASSAVGVESEHLLSESLMAALRAARLRQPGTADDGRVLLACAEEEQHVLPLHALASALGEHRVGSRLIGARVPADALAAAVRRGGPAVVVLWSQTRATAVPELFTGLPPTRPSRRLLAAGPGWGDVALPPGVRRVGALGEAVDEVLDALGRPPVDVVAEV